MAWITFMIMVMGCFYKVLKVYFVTFTELDVIFRGSDAINANGITYTISDYDHPATSMTTSPFATQKSSSYFIGLSISEV